MKERDKKFDFLHELTRRRVLRAAAAYIVVAWIAVQVGSIVFPEFDAPAWSMRALIIAFVVGFPPAILLAWIIDFSPQGFTRTTDSGYVLAHGNWPRFVTVLIATGMSAGVLWWVWDDHILQSGQRPLRTTIKSQPLIAVNSPRQRVGSPENEWLGDASRVSWGIASQSGSFPVGTSGWTVHSRWVGPSR